jgi:hypothetical protein
MSPPARHGSWWQRLTNDQRIGSIAGATALGLFAIGIISKEQVVRQAGLGAGAVLAGAFAFFVFYRPWHTRWGATDDELTRAMPGDDLIERPTFNATRAVTIDALPKEVWPWLVQIGFGRAGWYSYDWLDNLGRPSAYRIIPELQHIEVGTLIPMGPGKDSGLRVKGFEPNRWMLWSDRKATSTWAWGLYPAEGGGTRLITRVRTHYQWTHPAILFSLLLVEPWDFPMMRKCMRTILRRAQSLANQR